MFFQLRTLWDSLACSWPSALLCVPEVLVGLRGQLTGRPVSSCLFFKRKNVSRAVQHCGLKKPTLIRRLMKDGGQGSQCGLRVDG